MNCNLTGKLPVTLFLVYIFWTNKASLEEVIVYVLRKKRTNTWGGMFERVFFRKLTSFNLATSQGISFFTCYFYGFYLNEHFRMANSFPCTKCLKSNSERIYCCRCWLKLCNLYMPFVTSSLSFCRTSAHDRFWNASAKVPL